MSTQQFVDQLYIRFLGRAADSAGSAYWSTVIDSGIANAAQVTQQFLDSPEFADAVQPLARLYYTAFGRIPDAGGLSYWLQQAQAGVPLDAIGNAFAASAEFAAAYGRLDHDAFIDALWTAAIGRATDAGFKAYWLDALAQGATRADVLRSLADSHEVIGMKSEAIKVIAQYHGTLGAAPTQQEIDAALLRRDPLDLIANLYGRADYDGAAVPGLIARGMTATPGATVFIDRNGNGMLDANELSVQSGAAGEYSFDQRASFEGTLVELPLSGGGSGGGAVLIDTAAPTLTGQDPVDNASNASLSTFVLTFSEAVAPHSGNIVITNGRTQATLSGGVLQTRIVGATDQRVIPVSDAQVSISGAVVTVTLAQPLAGNSNYSLVIAPGAFKDAAGNSFAGITDTNQMSFTTTTSVDTVRPVALDAWFLSGGFLKVGDTVDISVSFSEAVEALNSAYLLLETGASDRSAFYVSGNGSNTLVFRYTVQTGDTSDSLALALDSGTYGIGLVSQVKDAAGNFVNAASVSLGSAIDYAGSPTADAELKTIRVDGIKPLNTAGPVLDPGWDTGSNSDNITYHDSLVFHGTGVQVGDEVELYVDGVSEPIGRSAAVTDADAGWTISAVAVAPGVRVFHVVVIDPAGNRSDNSFTTTVTIDKTASALANMTLDAGSDTGSSASDGLTRDATPTFSGTGAEANATITLYEYINDVLTPVSSGTHAADGSGNWSVTANTLAHGAHTLYARQTDKAGNISALGASLSITIDTEVPAAPAGAPALAAGSNSGSTSDSTTNVVRPTMTGTGAVAGQQVVIYDDEEEVLVVTANGSGEWTYTPSADMAQGEHAIQVSFRDNAGNESALSSALVLTIDSITPAIPAAPDIRTEDDLGTSSADNSTSVQSPHFTGSGAEAGTTITLYDGASAIGSAVVDSGGNYDITPTVPLANGSYSLTLKASDTAGNVSAASSATSVTIHKETLTAPLFPLMHPDDDKGSSSADANTSDTTPRVIGMATIGGKVELYEGTTLLGDATADGYGNWVITPTLAHGEHTVKAVLVDQYGNKSPDSTTLLITIDTDVPVAIASAPDLDAASDLGQSNSDNKTNDTTPSFTGSGALPEHWVAVYVNGTYVMKVQADGSGNYSGTIPAGSALAGGSYNLTVRNIDVAGNTSATDSPVLLITTDTETPSALPAPDLLTADDKGDSSSDNKTSDDTPRFSGTAEAGALVQLYEGETLLGQAYADITTQAWEITSSSLSNGEHQLTLVTTDIFGNKSVTSSATLVDIFKSTYTAPSTPDLTTDTGTSSTDNLTATTTPSFSGTATAGARVVLYEGSTVLGSATANGSGLWNITSSSLADGTHSVHAVVEDSYGNQGSSSATLSITVEVDEPATPSAPDLVASSDTGSSPTDNKTNDATPEIGGTGAVPNCKVNVFVDDVYVGYTLADSAGAWTYTGLSFASSGDYSITVRHENAAGADSADSPALVIKYDNNAPTILTAPELDAGSNSGSTSDNKTNDTTPLLKGVNEANASIAVYHGAVLLGTTTADADGIWSYQVGSSVGTGTQNFSYYATDVAGNTTGVSSILALDIDTTAPGASSAPDFDTTDDASDNGYHASNSDLKTNKTSGLTFSGTSAEIGMQVELYADNTLVGSTTTGGLGAWSITLASSLVEGEYDMVAYLVDEHGNKSAASGTTVLTVDTTAPSAPGTPSVASTPTNNTRPDITVSSAPGAVRVNFYHDGDFIGYATPDGSGNFVLSTSTYPSYPAFEEGPHGVTARAVDAAGNESGDSSSLSIEIDTIANVATPDLVSASDTGVSDSDNETADGTPSFSGSGMKPSTNLTVYFDGNPETVMADASGNWTFGTEIGSTSHTIYVTGYDAIGNFGTSATLNFTYDSSAPDIASSPGPSQGTGEDVVLTFSEAVYWDGTGTLTLQKGTDTPVSVPVNATFSADRMTVSFSGLTLVEGADYLLTLPSGFTDLAGNVLDTATASFGTDNTAPTASYSFSGATVTLDFSETIVFPSGSILIKDASTHAVTREITYSGSYWTRIDDDTITLDVSGTPIGSYYVVIDSSIADDAGNQVSIVGDSAITYTRLPA